MGVPRASQAARPPQGLLEALVVKRLHHIVDGGQFEGLERVPVVRRDEDCRRHLGRTHCADDIQSVHAGHLHVEEDEIGPERADRPHRRRAVRRGPRDLDRRVTGHEVLDTLAAQRLIVDDEDTE